MSETTPFSITYTSQVPQLLSDLNISLALTTYQAGKLVCISPSPDQEGLISLPRNFDKPMGVGISGDKMAIATKDEVIVLSESKPLASHYPNKKNVYDSLWLPRTTYYTGQVDLHDIKFCQDGIYAINSSFSCLCKIDENYNFTPVWQPFFIDKLASEDRCHLNGLATKNDKPKFATALGVSNTPQGWRDNIASGGVLMDIEDNRIIMDKLPMPHSPMYHNDKLYLLCSASGEFIEVNVENESFKVIKKFAGFCRGLDIYKDYAFIGFSKLRKNSSTFAKLSFAEEANYAGIKIVHLPTAAEVGEIRYKTSVDEIYEVVVLKDTTRPNVLNTMNPVHKFSLSIPDQTFWANPDDTVFGS